MFIKYILINKMKIEKKRNGIIEKYSFVIKKMQNETVSKIVHSKTLSNC